MLKSWGGLLILAFFLGACNSNAPHESDQPETAKGQTQMTDTQPKPEKDQPQTAQPEKKALPDGVYAAFDTTEGSFTARLFVDKTPQTVQNFIDLAQGRKAHRDPQTGQMAETRLYDGRKIFRVIDGFMFQTGSADDTNRYQSGFTIPGEVRPDLIFDKPGLLAMANTGSPDTGSCQFFVTLAPTPHLNGGYTIFGEVVEGLETVQKIGKTPIKRGGMGEPSEPVEPPVIHKVEIQRVGQIGGAQ